MNSSSNRDKSRPAMPEFYMPAMWPLDLQNAIVDWIGAWFWRRRMRRLLAQDIEGRIRLGGARGVVEQGAGEPLRLIAQRRARWLRP
ncbi:hypothetical protein SAMN03159511_0692 [Pseudomonas sp. NFACC19-2]|jgi:hypothetical protein|uniref:Uncharacterized protein n=2 Tax=Pseudomonadaceae TaxID=135621 RepID=A0A1H2L6X7_9PSED|nr:MULTISPECIES: hypothetical protein [Pseudomonas]KJU77058.1 hypothetical protein N619_31280 [Pseudomonas oleovorans]MBJ7548931.1 hypothetical protein [Pseudomonas sp. OA3]AXO62519.1 hypothetical protein DZC76_15660 [Pseudomonas sp. phDV1]KQO28117.1 hypothetical protein ASF15_17105 [Pseudomonas sp. Leaf83]MBG0844516.1 hypothetical protein [Pseudomonas chengduensis]